ncbi:ABC transporter permease subunit [Vagococcus vulneris]|uniref:ABC transporter permease n=1 Tax=Vagococcus vulneris TaxID=1977869 RepID=A0A430A1Z5_9ENTE|nr:ABC transporter permease subunit [Vagococcus vulneris]RSU00493.1 hypothetical protein CBF37_00325 [Vagococcus vulneris]
MRNEWIKEFKQPMNWLYIAICLILPIIIFTGFSKDWFGGFYRQSNADRLQVDIALMQFEKVDVKYGDDIYQNLAEQESLLARRYNSMLFNQPEKFKEVSYELAQKELTARESKNFLEIKDFQPPLYEVQKNNALFEYLVKHNAPYVVTPLTQASFLITCLLIFGLIWFPICAVLTSKALTDELQHKSLTKTQPNSFWQRTSRKLLSKMTIIIFGLMSSTAISLLLVTFFGDDTNDFSYKTIVHFLKFTLIDNWQWLVIYISYLIVMFLFTFVLSVFLNQTSKSFSLTLLIELAVYFFIILIGDSGKLSPLFFGYYLVPSKLFEGRFMLPMINPLTGFAYLMIFTILLIMVINIVRRRSNR